MGYSWSVRKRQIILLVHNLRSALNVGSIMRTADGFGVNLIIFCGYTPYPKHKNDNRLPHIADKNDNQISKTALGAEKNVEWKHSNDILTEIKALKDKGTLVVALERTPKSVALQNFKSSSDIGVILSNEVHGLEKEIQENVDFILEIPMIGQKESFNVAAACAIALYHLKYIA